MAKPEELLVGELAARHMTIAAAESCTGGYIAKRLTDVPGASEVFAGACVTYTCDAKEKLVGVSHGTLVRFGAVSEQTAKEMAEGVRRVLGTDFGVSATGIAGPGGGTPEQPVGTVWTAIAGPRGTSAVLLHLSPDATREGIRYEAVSKILTGVLEQLVGD